MKLGFVSAILPEFTLAFAARVLGLRNANTFIGRDLAGRQAALRVAGNVLRPFFGNSTRPVSNPA